MQPASKAPKVVNNNFSRVYTIIGEQVEMIYEDLEAGEIYNSIGDQPKILVARRKVIAKSGGVFFESRLIKAAINDGVLDPFAEESKEQNVPVVEGFEDLTSEVSQKVLLYSHLQRGGDLDSSIRMRESFFESMVSKTKKLISKEELPQIAVAGHLR